MVSINEAVKVIRCKKEMSQKKLAAELGVSRTSVSNLETGTNNPSWEMLLGLSAAFSMRLSSIIRVAELLDAGDPDLPEIKKLTESYSKNADE